MPRARIIIADSKETNRRVLKDILSREGFQVQAEAKNAPDLLRKTRTLLPDLVILDANLEGGSYMEIAGIIEDDNISTVLLLTGENQSKRLDEIAHIQKPYTESTLLTVIEVCLLYRNKVVSIQNEVDKLKDNLNSRKAIEKAKGIIMKNLGLTENEAYRMMQKQSMDRGTSMKELARTVIANEDIQSKDEYKYK